MDDVMSLFGAMASTPLLPGARCRGKHHLFDAAAPGESVETLTQRQFQALGLCERCPSLDRCREWFVGLPASQKPSGVVAGIVNNPTLRKRSRSA